MPLFGSKKKAPPPKESIAKLRETLDMLEKREGFLQKKADAEIANAKKFMQQKNKRAALMCLKRKKTYEAQMEKLSGARMTIETQVMALEGANVNMETIKAMKAGAASLKGIHQDMNIDQVDDVMDDIREQMDLATEISDAISQPLGGEVYDEDELLNELEELEQESLDEQFLGGLNKAPAVPSGKLPVAATPSPAAAPSKSKAQVDEDAELAALEASMAL
eukprot:TRINITY_DN14137_c0_g1_i1.p1 TRINITY_DN14137_c0_g1~~TRINITY_DN14137_c0_g1_i1.p1  ORF type:complete len:221 (+),score=31.18 TRINITY_DN14137_c0_g1_i1:143-805(+)